jgi:hypothetical protein
MSGFATCNLERFICSCGIRSWPVNTFVKLAVRQKKSARRKGQQVAALFVRAICREHRKSRGAQIVGDALGTINLKRACPQNDRLSGDRTHCPRGSVPDVA